MAIQNTVSSDFCPRSSIVKIIFDCRLSGVYRFFLYFVGIMQVKSLVLLNEIICLPASSLL